MSNIVACPTCGANLANSPELAGQVVACSQCQTQLQMPAMAAPAPIETPPLPPPAAGPPATSAGVMPPGVAIPPQPTQQPTQQSEQPSALDRVRGRKTNSLALFFTALGVTAIVGIGAAAFYYSSIQDSVKRTRTILVGNWRLEGDAGQIRKWEFAFHNDGKFQMLTATDTESLEDGRWQVTWASGQDAVVRLRWPDGTSEDLRANIMSQSRISLLLASLGEREFKRTVDF